MHRHDLQVTRAESPPGYTGSRGWDAYFTTPRPQAEPEPATQDDSSSGSDTEQPHRPELSSMQGTGTARGQQGPVLDADFEEVTGVEIAVPAASGRAEKTQEPSQTQQAAEKLRRKSNLLLDMVAAGAEVDKVIAENIYEVDDYLIGLLESRIETAQEFDDDDVVEGLLLLWQRLRIERDRFNATPAQRLLDDALHVMAVSTPADYSDRLKEVRRRLESAFTPPGMEAAPVNIFGVASILGQGGELPPEEIVGEFVAQWQFLAEGKDLLKQAMDEQHELEHVLQTGLAKEQEEEVREVFEERAAVVTQLQEILAIASSIKPDL
ncbi:hypothetical protein WJX72_008420 [[Myrmecia] bisecta]|uniref:Uncharacterized protein n=1 Tax=[Myrmecia] bisecta TaxID=41462 RepID=A0AAW1QRV3_9CHLO